MSMNNWGKGLAAVAFFSILAIPCLANGPANSFIPTRRERSRSLRQIWHYVVTHKEVLVADVLAVSAFSADAASTVYDQHHCTCVETNPLLGRHPSGPAIWSYGIGAATVQIAWNHLIWHYAPAHMDRHLIWFEMAPLIGVEAFNIYSNVHAADIAPLGHQSSNTHIAYGLPITASQFSIREITTLSSSQGNRFAALRHAATRTRPAY